MRRIQDIDTTPHINALKAIPHHVGRWEYCMEMAPIERRAVLIALGLPCAGGSGQHAMDSRMLAAHFTK